MFFSKIVLYFYGKQKTAMKQTITIILIIVAKVCIGQNLVNNWSFEDTVACPMGVTQIAKAAGWASFKATPDYYNYCNGGMMGVPSNFGGFQYARTGVAYAGFITYARYATNIREIIGSTLNQQLVVGQIYYISFFVSRSYNVAYHNNVASNKVGLKFSTIPYPNYWTNPISINDSAHVYSNSVITDTTNWVKISGSFTADSTYNYFAIGNFYSDSLTTHILLDSIGAVAYYYIDDVCISPDSSYCNSLTGLTKNDFTNPLTIYPNPFKNLLSVEGIGFSEIEMYDNLGKLVFSQIYGKLIYKTQIDLSLLNSGFYLIKIKTRNSCFTKKIIHQ